MKTPKDLKILTQLLIGFGTILTFPVILGLNAWLQTDKIASGTTHLYDHSLAIRRALGELTKDILLIHRGMKDLVFVTGNEEFERIILESESFELSALQQINILYDQYPGPKSDIDSVYNSFIIWEVIREETSWLIRQNQLEEAFDRTKYHGVGGQQVEVLLSQIDRVDNFARNKSDQIYKDIIMMNNILNRRLLILVLSILIISVLTVYTILRNIRRPLSELTMVTQQFQAGRFDARSGYISKNEFGFLSDSFNLMAEKLETEFRLVNNSAELANVMLHEEDAQRFCHALLNNLTGNAGAQSGAIYLLNAKRNQFEHFASLGFSKDVPVAFSAESFEGEFGLALSMQTIRRIRNIPDDSRMVFKAVSGEYVPREIITMPLVVEDKTVAFISLATITGFAEDCEEYLNVILPTVSARMGGILANRQVHDFSRELEAKNAELEAQASDLSEFANEVSAQNTELEVQKKQLDNANRMKTVFLSNMSHELRTPLNSIIALSEVLTKRLTSKITEEDYSYLGVIERNSRHLLAIINDILDLARIESGKEDLEFSCFRISDLLHDVVQTVEPLAIQKGLELDYDIGHTWPEIISDFEKCRHILTNILSNAVKFTDVGKVEIRVEPRRKYIHIIISDTGIGIDETFLPHIFDEFRQADNTSSKYPGTGLGLTIAKKFADMINARITVKSTKGKGSVFTLILPLHSGNNQVRQYQGTGNHHLNGPESSVPVPFHGKTILLVEDTEAVIIQVKDMLEEHGYKVITARNGQEAMSLLTKSSPDAVILDLMMPGLDGFEVLTRLRASESTRLLPVMILTSKMVTKEEHAILKHNNIYQLIYKGSINKVQLFSMIDRMVALK